MKKFGVFLIVVCLFIIAGFSSSHKKIDDKAPSSHITNKPSFTIKSVDAHVLSFTDPAANEVMKGVEYNLLVITDQPPERLRTLKFQLKGDSLMKKAVVSPEPISCVTLEKTSPKGNLYSVVFATSYSSHYTADELERLKKDRDFQLYVYSRGVKVLVPFE
ncbi:hypothetical protein [Falsibacillus pallidus]|uniref:hypothetical protein n=1 Tax=Falsibacillus pallidus TaxID=493781 RepID=UPI003D97A070